LCPCKVRNKFLVTFWNRTILLCIPCISRQGYGEVASYVKAQSIPCPRGVREENEKSINLVCHQPKYKLDITRMWVRCTPVRWNGLDGGCKLSTWQNWSKSCEWDSWCCGRDSKRARNTSTPSVLTHLVKSTIRSWCGSSPLCWSNFRSFEMTVKHSWYMLY
jgi:hypothetical protein